MSTTVLRKQQWRNAQFHCNLILDELKYLEHALTCSINKFTRDPTSPNPIPPNCFSEADIEQTHRLVCHEDFNPLSRPHLQVVMCYIDDLLSSADQDRRLLATETCQDAIIRRWLCWEEIELRLGFEMPFLGIVGLPHEQRRPFVRALWQKAWAAIRHAAPKDIQERSDARREGAMIRS